MYTNNMVVDSLADRKTFEAILTGGHNSPKEEIRHKQMDSRGLIVVDPTDDRTGDVSRSGDPLDNSQNDLQQSMADRYAPNDSPGLGTQRRDDVNAGPDVRGPKYEEASVSVLDEDKPTDNTDEKIDHKVFGEGVVLKDILDLKELWSDSDTKVVIKRSQRDFKVTLYNNRRRMSKDISWADLINMRPELKDEHDYHNDNDLGETQPFRFERPDVGKGHLLQRQLENVSMGTEGNILVHPVELIEVVSIKQSPFEKRKSPVDRFAELAQQKDSIVSVYMPFEKLPLEGQDGIKNTFLENTRFGLKVKDKAGKEFKLEYWELEKVGLRIRIGKDGEVVTEVKRKISNNVLSPNMSNEQLRKSLREAKGWTADSIQSILNIRESMANLLAHMDRLHHQINQTFNGKDVDAKVKKVYPAEYETFLRISDQLTSALKFHTVEDNVWVEQPLHSVELNFGGREVTIPYPPVA